LKSNSVKEVGHSKQGKIVKNEYNSLFAVPKCRKFQARFQEVKQSGEQDSEGTLTGTKERSMKPG